MATCDGAPRDDSALTVAELDRLDRALAAAELMACCASRRWVSSMVAGRPYRSPDRLLSASDRALDELAWTDVLEAVAAHPRIGERATGGPATGGPATGATIEAEWSRQEQSGAADADADAGRELVAVNRAYEARFGHVFLVCATGLSAGQLIDAARARLTNDPLTERLVVAGELGRIVRLRLAKAFR